MANANWGSLVAFALAGLFATGACSKPKSEPESSGKSATMSQGMMSEKLKCEGINACKGQGGCKGGGHDCAGKNGCKGQGWVEVASKDECAQKGGKMM